MTPNGFPLDDAAELFAVAAEYFRKSGYLDAWLLDVASESLVRGDVTLARACLATFEKHRTLYGLEAEIVSSLWRVLESDAPALAEAEEEIEDLVEGDD